MPCPSGARCPAVSTSDNYHTSSASCMQFHHSTIFCATYIYYSPVERHSQSDNYRTTELRHTNPTGLPLPIHPRHTTHSHATFHRRNYDHLCRGTCPGAGAQPRPRADHRGPQPSVLSGGPGARLRPNRPSLFEWKRSCGARLWGQPTTSSWVHRTVRWSLQ